MKIGEFKDFHFPEVESTMLKAWEISRIEKGSFVVRATRQTNGYGRKGARWESPEGGLWFTAVFPSQRLSGLSAFLALVIFRVLREYCGELKIKWPNDIVHFHKKVCGILIEVKERVFWGVGINLNNEIPSPLADLAISLKDLTGTTLDSEEVLRRVIKEFSATSPSFEEMGFSPFKKEYEKSLVFLGNQVQILSGEKLISGIADGISEEGFLKLATPAGPLLVRDGTVVKF